MGLDALLGVVFCVFSGIWLIVENAFAFGDGLLPLALWTLWLGGGCLAATAAELLGKPVLPHALLGLCLPYVYPVLLVRSARKTAALRQEQAVQAEEQAQAERASALSARFHAMQEKRDLERRERLAQNLGVSADEIPARPAPEPESSVPEPAVEPVPEAAPEVRNEIYDILYTQPVDDSGSRPGPFQFTLAAGGTLDVDAVRELAPQFMVCVVSGSGKSVRIKYAQVASIARYETET